MLEIIAPRVTSLGESITVRRTLPTRGHTTIGAWCFADHYGPIGEAMDVGPHPHTELQTASWLFSGEIEHRDSAGHHALVKPGELNLMTAGPGISHSEVSTKPVRELHGVQLWVALPAAARHVDPSFETVPSEHVTEEDFTAKVFLGEWLGARVHATTHSPLLGAELTLSAHAQRNFALNESFEHGLLVDAGDVRIDGERIDPHHLVYLPRGTRNVTIETRTLARLLLLGGEPLGEKIVMWWNFIGRSRDDILEYRERWESGALQSPIGDLTPRIPAPEMPNVHLKLR